MDVSEMMVLITGLSSATDYFVSVAAVNENGELGPAYNVTVRTLPSTTATSGMLVNVYYTETP